MLAFRALSWRQLINGDYMIKYSKPQHFPPIRGKKVALMHLIIVFLIWCSFLLRETFVHGPTSPSDRWYRWTQWLCVKHTVVVAKQSNMSISLCVGRKYKQFYYKGQDVMVSVVVQANACITQWFVSTWLLQKLVQLWNTGTHISVFSVTLYVHMHID